MKSDVPYHFGKTKRSFAEKPIASTISGSATYYQLSRGWAGRSTHHVIYTTDGQYIKSRNAESAIKKLLAL